MTLQTNKYPLFSIVTITLDNYNGLKKTYESVIKQTFNDFEWLVIDGQSSDDTLNFLRAYRTETRQNQYPFTFISEKDRGIYDAMNKGIENSKGRYIIFLNAGDQLANPTTLELISKHTKDNPDFIYGDSLEPTKKKPIYKKAKNHKNIEWGMFTHHQAMIYNRLTIREGKMHYSLRYKIASDYDFTARFIKESKQIIYIPKPICIFEQGGLSQKQASLGRKEQYIIRENLEIVSQPRNLWILLTHIITWKLRNLSPNIYNSLRNLTIR